MADWVVSLLQAINDSPLSVAARETVWLFPYLETLHVIAIVFVVGSIVRLDLRLLGLVWQSRAITEVADEMLPWTWTAFVIAAMSGLLLFASKPFDYLEIAFFVVKMILILLAGLNMAAFQFVTYKHVARWDRDPIPPKSARIAGALSLGLWLGVVICGRFIGFV